MYSSDELLILHHGSIDAQTTLLNILADQRVGCARFRGGDGPGRGSVLLDGRPRGPGYRNLVGFVPQGDALHDYLSVRESVEEAAALHLRGKTGVDRAACVQARSPEGPGPARPLTASLLKIYICRPHASRPACMYFCVPFQNVNLYDRT